MQIIVNFVTVYVYTENINCQNSFSNTLYLSHIQSLGCYFLIFTFARPIRVRATSLPTVISLNFFPFILDSFFTRVQPFVIHIRIDFRGNSNSDCKYTKSE